MSKSAKVITVRKATDKHRTKADQILTLLTKPKGASIPELMKATGWQAHSIRGFMSGTAKRKGIAIENEKNGDERRYRISAGRAAS